MPRSASRRAGGSPAWKGTEIATFEAFALTGDRARVTATVNHTFSDRKYSSVEEDVVYLERLVAGWRILQPSATLYRAVGYPFRATVVGVHPAAVGVGSAAPGQLLHALALLALEHPSCTSSALCRGGRGRRSGRRRRGGRGRRRGRRWLSEAGGDRAVGGHRQRAGRPSPVQAPVQPVKVAPPALGMAGPGRRRRLPVDEARRARGRTGDPAAGDRAGTRRRGGAFTRTLEEAAVNVARHRPVGGHRHATTVRPRAAGPGPPREDGPLRRGGCKRNRRAFRIRRAAIGPAVDAGAASHRAGARAVSQSGQDRRRAGERRRDRPTVTRSSEPSRLPVPEQPAARPPGSKAAPGGRGSRRGS